MNKIDPLDHIGLIHTVAHRWVTPSPNMFPLDDRLSVGYIALVKAIENYNPAKGVAFSSYAYVVIQRHLHRHQITNEHQGFAMPYNPVEPAPKVGTMPRKKEINDRSILNEDLFELIDNKDYIETILSRCSKKEKYILNNMLQGRSQVEIAKDLGCGKANVSRIYNLVLKRERELYNANSGT